MSKPASITVLDDESKSELSEDNLKIVDDLSKCLNINNSIIRYGLYENNVYINLTDLCKANKKLYGHWRELSTTTPFLQSLKEATHNDNLIIIVRTGKNENRASWGHPQVAIDIAYWISPEFRVMVTKWVYELGLLGKVDLTNQLSTQELDSIAVDTLQKQIEEEKEKRIQAEKNTCRIMKRFEKLNNSSIGACVRELEASEGQEQCLRYENRQLRERIAQLENDNHNMQAELNVFRAEARNDLYEPARDKSRNRSYMAYCLMEKFMSPIYVKMVTAREIIKKYPPNDNKEFVEWYKDYTPPELSHKAKRALIKKRKEQLKRHKEENYGMTSSDEDTDTEHEDSTDQRRKRQEKKTKIAPKKTKKSKKKALSCSDESEEDPIFDEIDASDLEEASDNDLDVKFGDNYQIYKRRTDSTKKRFYHITMNHTKKQKYAAILYGDQRTFKYLIDYYKTHSSYRTPDPTVFYTSISSIDACLRKLFIKI